jgi:hypothetical protein
MAREVAVVAVVVRMIRFQVRLVAKVRQGAPADPVDYMEAAVEAAAHLRSNAQEGRADRVRKVSSSSITLQQSLPRLAASSVCMATSASTATSVWAA